uniref:Uncharacterized protein n=1 Tax=Candidatus Nitrotoga fabula TaxID=2182327 RepID=A0A2X0QRJ7_9PROT|nr:protein of unknown function [Candidatus Nitrotoga fabula]
MPFAGFAVTFPAPATAVPDNSTVAAIIFSNDDTIYVDLRISPPYFLKFFNCISS